MSVKSPVEIEAGGGRREITPSAATFCSASVLDACCGSRMFWFDRADGRAVFVDKRRETHITDTRPGRSALVVNPDILADFTNLPFKDNRFSLVVFDPPHIIRNEARGWITKKYGVLNGDWQEMLRLGFAECFRVLKPEGTLVFKWSSSNVPLAKILALTPEKPLFGNRCGKTAQSHWIVYQKPNAKSSHAGLKAHD